jgi:Fe-S-cluster containining protein
LFNNPKELADALSQPLREGDLSRVRGLLAQALSLWRPMDQAGAWAVLESHDELAALLAGEIRALALAEKLSQLAASRTCLGCGSCCRTSSPTLYAEDLPLIESGVLPKHLLFTLRTGEAAYSARLARLENLPAELIKLQEQSGACCFLRGSRCAAYEGRPLQCRHLECWSGRHAGQLSGRPRLARADIFKGDDTALALLSEYEVKLPAADMAARLHEAAQGSGQARLALLQALELDHHLRAGIKERYGYGPDIQPLLLGRPLRDLLPAYGLELRVNQNGQPVLTALPARRQ